MNQRERVLRAIEFRHPDRPPVWFFNRDQERGDILRYPFHLTTPDGTTEWGYRWVSLGDGTKGQPGEPVLASWDQVETYRFPTGRREERLSNLPAFIAKSKGYYRLAGCGITGFTNYTFLRGFEEALAGLCTEPERAAFLLDGIFATERELMALAAESGMDGFHLNDDWGTQESLLISPVLWRQIFKPRYRAHVAHAHQLGLHIWFHSCGNIGAIVDDLHEIGVDVINISQPNAVDLAPISLCLKEKQCFMLPASYQTTSIQGGPEEIEAEAHRLFQLFGSARGGFVGYVEEYGCVGMPEENYVACVRAFTNLR